MAAKLKFENVKVGDEVPSLSIKVSRHDFVRYAGASGDFVPLHYDQTFAEAAAAQKPLIETDQTRAAGLGTMTGDRWKDLADQLVKLGVIDSSVDPQQCFVNP